MDNGSLYPAIGLSFGLEPIFVILNQKENKESLIDLYLVPLDTNIECMKLATILRDKGVRVLIEMNKKKVGKCFEYAEHENINYISVIGSQEIETQVVRIKNMQTKEETEINIKELPDFFKK